MFSLALSVGVVILAVIYADLNVYGYKSHRFAIVADMDKAARHTVSGVVKRQHLLNYIHHIPLCKLWLFRSRLRAGTLHEKESILG